MVPVSRDELMPMRLLILGTDLGLSGRRNVRNRSELHAGEPGRNVGNKLGTWDCLAALLGKKARRGVLISTSAFTKEAVDYAENLEAKIVLIDGDRLATLMVEHNLGVSVVQAYEVKRIDSDYFSEEV